MFYNLPLMWEQSERAILIRLLLHYYLKGKGGRTEPGRAIQSNPIHDFVYRSSWGFRLDSIQLHIRIVSWWYPGISHEAVKTIIRSIIGGGRISFLQLSETLNAASSICRFQPPNTCAAIETLEPSGVFRHRPEIRHEIQKVEIITVSRRFLSYQKRRGLYSRTGNLRSLSNRHILEHHAKTKFIIYQFVSRRNLSSREAGTEGKLGRSTDSAETTRRHNHLLLQLSTTNIQAKKKNPSFSSTRKHQRTTCFVLRKMRWHRTNRT